MRRAEVRVAHDRCGGPDGRAARSRALVVHGQLSDVIAAAVIPKSYRSTTLESGADCIRHVALDAWNRGVAGLNVHVVAGSRAGSVVHERAGR